MTILIPIVNQANKYVDGLEVAYASSTTLTMASGAARDSTNVNDIVLSAGVTINCASIGANGIDAGALANSTWYYVYVIGSSNNTAQPAGLVSSSATAPAMPQGYDMWRMIDVQRTDGSAHFLLSYNQGHKNQRLKVWDATIAVISSGTATSLTLVDLSGAVPPIESTPIFLEVGFTPATAADKVSFAVVGSTATSLPCVSSVVAAKVQNAQVKLLSKLSSSVAKIQYINSAASGNTDAKVSGFEMSL